MSPTDARQTTPKKSLLVFWSSRHVTVQTTTHRTLQSLAVGQLHWAPPLGWQEEAYWKGLSQLRASGRIREVGLSNYGPKGVARAHRFLDGLGTPLASNQVCVANLSSLIVLISLHLSLCVCLCLSRGGMLPVVCYYEGIRGRSESDYIFTVAEYNTTVVHGKHN